MESHFGQKYGMPMECRSGQKWSRIFWSPEFLFCGREQFFLIEIIFFTIEIVLFYSREYFCSREFFFTVENFFIVENFFVVEIFFTVENFFIVENFLQREFFYCRDIYRRELFTVENIFQYDI